MEDEGKPIHYPKNQLREIMAHSSCLFFMNLQELPGTQMEDEAKYPFLIVFQVLYKLQKCIYVYVYIYIYLVYILNIILIIIHLYITNNIIII